MTETFYWLLKKFNHVIKCTISNFQLYTRIYYKLNTNIRVVLFAFRSTLEIL
jgi:hypothetical protein